MIRKLLLSLCLLFAFTYAEGQTPTNVNVVAPVFGTPSAYLTITGQSHSTDSYIYASGYFQPGDGGAGYFAKVPGTCDQSVSASVSGATVTISSPLSFPLSRGMGISGTSIPMGDTIDSFVTTASGVTTIWLSQTAGTYSGSITINGGNGVNGGSKIADSAGNCFVRASAFTGNVLSGAVFAPVWSGWTVMPTNALAYDGAGYSVGDVVTFSGSNQVTNQSQNAQIVADVVDGSGAITAFHFANYGSYVTMPDSSTNMIGSGGTGTTPAQLAPNWSYGTLATTIYMVNTVSGNTQITPTDTSQLKSGYDLETVQVWYYGHDDGAAINLAIANSPGGADVILPANCGTTVQINLPNNTGVENPALRGLSTSASGIYAFGDPGIVPMNHVAYVGPNGGGHGGGLKNLVVEALGITEGKGLGYQVPPTNPITQNGSVVEIDNGQEMHFDNVSILDGFGSGNSDFQCAPQDADPNKANLLYPNHPGVIWMLNSRAVVPNPLSASYSPDYAIEASGCHDSYFTNVNAFNSTVANIRLDQNHLLSPHVFNNNTPPLSKNASLAESQFVYPGYPGILGYPGVATWGVWISGHSWVTDEQCDSASRACLFLNGMQNTKPSNIFGVKADCGGGNSVAAGFYGVEVGANAVNANIMGIGGEGSCNIPASQLINFDGTPDPSVQVFGNTTSSFAQLTLPTFTQPQGRLSLSSSQSVMTADVIGGTIVYYLPYEGANVPVRNGQMYAPQSIGAVGISLALSTTAHPHNNLFDIYAIFNPTGSAPTLCSGPAWLGPTTRGSSIALTNYRGIWVNGLALTCQASSGTASCAALACTYLGTMYTTGDGQTSMQFGPNGLAAGNCNVLGIWNAYNRVHAFSESRDTTTSWKQATASTWEPADAVSTGGGLCNRVTFVDGLQQSNINTVETQPLTGVSTSAQPSIGVVLDSTTATPVLAAAQQNNIATTSVAYSNWNAPLLGLHYAQAMENAVNITSVLYQGGLSLQLNWEY